MDKYQGTLNPVFLTPFSKAKFYALGMRCFAALFWKIWLPPARWMFAWWLRSAKSPHLTRVNSRIHILYRFAHGCVGTASGKKNAGVGPMRETMAKGSELPGHEGKRRGRHCTGTGRGAAQSEGSALHRLRHTHKTKGFAEIERCAVTARGVARGNARGVARPMPCNACIENVQTLYVCRWWFPALSLLHTGGGTADPLQDLIAQIDQIMIGGERRNLSNNTAMLRGLAQLFVHIPQSMHMPQPKIILKKRGLRKRGLELYGSFVPKKTQSSFWTKFMAKHASLAHLEAKKLKICYFKVCMCIKSVSMPKSATEWQKRTISSMFVHFVCGSTIASDHH